MEDGSGGEAYFYGKLGETVKTIKTIILAEADIRSYIWEADYDSWGRVNSMTYPDGEVVSYSYDKGGNLLVVSTRKGDDIQTLIAEQLYDKFGKLTYRKMGNGTETRYDYDDKRQHLNQMSLTSSGVKLMENVYSYDNVDNILSISNSVKPSGSVGGAFSHSYQYDALNRLVSATGTAKDKSYDLMMRYDAMSNPIQKDTVLYEYETIGHSNAASRVGSQIYAYDLNGNPISVRDTTANTLRVMQWDEENRLQSLGDDGYVSRYTYNHLGERVVKSHGGTTVAYVNGAPQGVLWHDKDRWTMYVSPYMVVNAKRFTKHYYVDGQRIASKIGEGDFNNLYDASKASVTAGQKDYAERLKLITESRNDYYAALGIPPGPPTAKGLYGEAEYHGAYGSHMIKPLGNYDVPAGWPMKPYKRPYGGTPGPPVMYQKPTDPEDEGAGYGYSNAEQIKEKDVYFYHTDHLGSTTYVTDVQGNATQFVCYKPYGETLVDEHATSHEQPWKFNGKEWDAETGLYYYGARYYEPKLAMWYGVDKLAEKYPSIGGYVYCVGNPVRLVDVDGNDWYQNEETGAVIWKNGHAETVDIDGLSYYNIGSSFSYKMLDDSYANFYQNFLVSTSKEPENGFKVVVNSDFLSCQFMRRKFPLDNASKAAIMQERVRTSGIGTLIYGRGNYEYYFSISGNLSFGCQFGVNSIVEVEGNLGAITILDVTLVGDCSGICSEIKKIEEDKYQFRRGSHLGCSIFTVGYERSSTVTGGHESGILVDSYMSVFHRNKQSSYISLSTGGKMLFWVDINFSLGVKRK